MPDPSSSLHHADDHEQPGPCRGSGDLQSDCLSAGGVDHLKPLPVCSPPQFPQELVTYGGNGQVFSNWAQVRLTFMLCIFCTFSLAVEKEHFILTVVC